MNMKNIKYVGKSYSHEKTRVSDGVRYELYTSESGGLVRVYGDEENIEVANSVFKSAEEARTAYAKALRINESADLYGKSPAAVNAFRAQFGTLPVAGHAKIAADAKAAALKHKNAYEKRGHKAHGESGGSNMAFYFDASEEGKQYNRLMAIYRRHDKIAKLLTKSGRATLES